MYKWTDKKKGTKTIKWVALQHRHKQGTLARPSILCLLALAPRNTPVLSVYKVYIILYRTI